jgi:septal ring factor EnvC (AmiA/AmiB activator)
MASKHDEPGEVGQAALVLIHGDSPRRTRPLNREALALGRAHGCDICLEAPDVSALHCLITRRGSGWQVRDCGSRSGTHVNGDAIREPVALHDSDILQVGPFSFRVHLPAAGPGGRPNREQRLECSRRNLGRLALALRRRLRNLCSGGEARDLERRRTDLVRQTAALEERVRDYEQRFQRLDQAERDLCRDRQALAQEQAAFQERLHQLEKQRKETAVPPREEEGLLEGRRRELDAYAQHLMRLHKNRLPLGQPLDQLTRGIQAMQLEQQQTMKSREEWAREQAEATARLAQQRAALAQAEASLREQRAGLTRLAAELKQMQDAIRQQQNAELEELRQENAYLHQLLEERDRQGPAPEDNGHLIGVPDLEAEIERLQQLLTERDAQLDQVQQPPPKAPVGDIGTYEAELNEFQRQLEQDRKKLNAEIEQLRIRNEEMEDATRDMELQLSRERAELARERQRLDRMREETRQELERVQREAGVRDRLAPVLKLREKHSGTEKKE